MKTSDFEYELPQEFIAQTPIEPRDSARLLVMDRAGGSLKQRVFRDLTDLLTPEDVLVLNETRVIPARLFARKVPSGGRVEILLLHEVAPLQWAALVGGKRVTEGQKLKVDDGPVAEIIAEQSGSQRTIQFSQSVDDWLHLAGHVPLPPYIKAVLKEPERYQTIYAQESGSAAAPTAGLHFTHELIDRLERLGVRIVKITLHVGLDTFAPVTVDDPRDHKIHTEWCRITPDVASVVNETKKAGGRVVAVGTTSVRALESACVQSRTGHELADFDGPTNLFILPGFVFRVVDAMITNFHLPRSSLLMLVSAFAGREKILSAYAVARQEGYRFYSFGDAMLIL